MVLVKLNLYQKENDQIVDYLLSYQIVLYCIWWETTRNNEIHIIALHTIAKKTLVLSNHSNNCGGSKLPELCAWQI